jgi:small subunit ribosomal protein S9
MSKPIINKVYIKSVGKRKTSIANVLLTPGTGFLEVNGISHTKFFASLGEEKDLLKSSLIFLKIDQNFDIFIKVHGGGLMSQLQAIQLGIAKALSQLGDIYKSNLSKNGFLYRDPRIKERRKYGLRKARKAPQYSKR